MNAPRLTPPHMRFVGNSNDVAAAVPHHLTPRLLQVAAAAAGRLRQSTANYGELYNDPLHIIYNISN